MLHNNYYKIFKYIHIFRTNININFETNASIPTIYNRLSTLMIWYSIIRLPSNFPFSVIILRIPPNKTDFPRDKSWVKLPCLTLEIRCKFIVKNYIAISHDKSSIFCCNLFYRWILKYLLNRFSLSLQIVLSLLCIIISIYIKILFYWRYYQIIINKK